MPRSLPAPHSCVNRDLLDDAAAAPTFLAVLANPVRRIRFRLQYDGEHFFGWQVQPGQRTVQGELEATLTRLFDRPARVIGSGRTDRGVHATGQVAATDAPPRWSPDALRRATNALLPADLWVEEAADVPPNFHPRYHAIARSYVYRVGLSPISRSPFHARWCWPVAEALHQAPMQRAAELLVGTRSFRSFAKAGQEERGDLCTVSAAEWRQWDAVGIEFHITANRFLHHMVRYLVGTLVAVGRGIRPASDLGGLLEPGTALITSPPAPPQGLYLREVSYP